MLLLRGRVSHNRDTNCDTDSVATASEAIEVTSNHTMGVLQSHHQEKKGMFTTMSKGVEEGISGTRYYSSDSDDSALGGSVVSATDVDTSYSNISSDVDSDEEKTISRPTEEDGLTCLPTYIDLYDYVRTQNGVHMDYNAEYTQFYEYQYPSDGSKESGQELYSAVPARQVSVDEITIHGDIPDYEFQISQDATECDVHSIKDDSDENDLDDIENASDTEETPGIKTTNMEVSSNNIELQRDVQNMVIENDNESTCAETEKSSNPKEISSGTSIPWHRSYSQMSSTDEEGDENSNDDKLTGNGDDTIKVNGDDKNTDDEGENHDIEDETKDSASDNEGSDENSVNDDKSDSDSDDDNDIVVSKTIKDGKVDDGEESEGAWISDNEDQYKPDSFKKTTIYRRSPAIITSKKDDDEDDYNMDNLFNYLESDDSDSEGENYFGFLSFFCISAGQGYAFPKKMPVNIKGALKFWENDYQVGDKIYPRMGSWEEKGLVPNRAENPRDYKTFLAHKSLYYKWLQCNKNQAAWYRKYAGKTLLEIANSKSRTLKRKANSCHSIDHSESSLSSVSQSGNCELDWQPMVETIEANNVMANVEQASNKRPHRGSVLDNDDENDSGPCVFDLFDGIV